MYMCIPLQAAVAGVISGQQLSLAVGMRDPLLATRCKLYLAYSLLQQGRLKQAAQIIRFADTINLLSMVLCLDMACCVCLV